jgi:ribosomal protein L21E
MAKKRFRIIGYADGDVTFYETKVKTWIGWISFSVFYKTDIVHILSDPSAQKSMALERINHYCQVKGYKKEDVVITEINESKSKKWIFFQRIYMKK